MYNWVCVHPYWSECETPHLSDLYCVFHYVLGATGPLPAPEEVHAEWNMPMYIKLLSEVGADQKVLSGCSTTEDYGTHWVSLDITVIARYQFPLIPYPGSQ